MFRQTPWRGVQENISRLNRFFMRKEDLQGVTVTGGVDAKRALLTWFYRLPSGYACEQLAVVSLGVMYMCACFCLLQTQFGPNALQIA